MLKSSEMLNRSLNTASLNPALLNTRGHSLYSHKLKQFVAGEKDHESRVAFLKYISLLLPALHED